MIITEIFRWQTSEPLWGVAVWCLLPLVMVEVLCLLFAGTSLRTSAVKAEKGWGLGVSFFVLGTVLEYGLATLLRLIFPYENNILINWLFCIVIALILVGVISFGMFHLLEWIDGALYDHYKKAEALRRKSLGFYQRLRG
ncbi:MAG: hypothetical protein ABFR90_01235 [Planctomycetota bacterium]